MTHPYLLVSMIALIEGIYFLLFNTIEEVCNLKLYEIWAYTVFFDGSIESQLRSLKMILNSGVIMFRFLFLLSFFLNGFLCMDLYLTVKSPFYPKERRLKWYVICSLVMTTPISIFEGYKYSKNIEGYKAEEATILSSFMFFVIVASITAVFAAKRILKPGISPQVRNMVIQRHIKYIIAVTISFLPYAVKIVMLDLLNLHSRFDEDFYFAANILFAS